MLGEERIGGWEEDWMREWDERRRTKGRREEDKSIV